MINTTDHNLIIRQYKEGVKRIILLDYDGTLVPFTKYPDKARVGVRSIGVIQDLLSDAKNTLAIISGRDKDFIEKEFDGLNIVLIAEHGYLMKDPGKAWQTLIEINTTWKNNIKTILQKYSDRCIGSFIEEKQSSLVWHYRNADPQLVTVQLAKLKKELKISLNDQKELSLLDGKKVLEVKSSRFNKGIAATQYVSKDKYDFILAIGDDITDEDMFKSLPEYAITIKIGYGPSNARYFIKKQTEVFEFIRSLYN